MNSFIKIKMAYDFNRIERGEIEEVIININHIRQISKDNHRNFYIVSFGNGTQWYVAGVEMKKIFQAIGVSL